VPDITARLRPGAFTPAPKQAASARAQAPYGGKPYISIAAYRRGRTLVVAAALVRAAAAAPCTTTLPRTLPPQAPYHPRPSRLPRTSRPALQAGVEDAVDAESLLQQPLSSHKSLVQGQLANGLRYVIMPNKTPPQRLEAHLEVHAGSVDEREDEQVRQGGPAVRAGGLAGRRQARR
jgi:hypothetical protein